MPLDVIQPAAQPVQARFTHENGTQLRLQCFVTLKDAQGRICVVRVQGIEGWCLPGESMNVNEAPGQAAQRVAKMWFETPLAPRLDRILSFPATGPEDDRWYLVFIFACQAPADLKGTSDTEEMAFRDLSEDIEFAMAHEDVWAGLRMGGAK